MKVFNVDLFGEITEIDLDLNRKFEYHKNTMDEYNLVKQDNDTITVVINYGPGACEATYYKNKEAAKKKAKEIKQARINDLNASIATITKEIEEL